MPDSYGKRQRNQVKARKAAQREERRVARRQRRAQGESGGVGWLAEEGNPAEAGEPEEVEAGSEEGEAPDENDEA